MYKLIKIKATGIRITIADGSDKAALDDAALQLAEQNPSVTYSVIEAA